MKILNEFKKFAIKGNVVDLAIGVIIGNSFNTIVNSLVNDIIMPPIGYASGGIKFNDYKIILKPAMIDEVTKKVTQEAVTFNYGNFIQMLINFVIVAFAMFLVVKVMNKMREKQEKKKTEELPAPPTEDIMLLREIRNALTKKK